MTRHIHQSAMPHEGRRLRTLAQEARALGEPSLMLGTTLLACGLGGLMALAVLFSIATHGC